MGDTIYSLLFTKILEIQKLFIDGGCNTVKFNWKSANFLLPLIEFQPYLQNKVTLYSNQNYDYNYGDHPDNIPVITGTNLTNYHASKFNLIDDERIHQPWLYAPINNDPAIKNKKIIINRTHRYHGNNQFYYDFLKYFHVSQLLFLGLEEEYDSFNKDFGNPNIDYIKTPTSLELASIINSIPTFVGNQSLICAIATGLGKNAFIEYCPGAANYIFNRQNIQYF
jgi:hypothetical protein